MQVPSEWNALPGMGDEHPLAWVVCYGEWAATGELTIPLPDGLGELAPDGDWWPTALESLVRERFETLRAA
jgi:uncharacterized protein